MTEAQKEHRKEYMKVYYQTNKLIMDARHRKYFDDNITEMRSYHNERGKRRFKENKLYALTVEFRANLNRGYGSVSKLNNIIGLPYNEFKNYIESKFEPWMNWENKSSKNCYTENITWDFDHIIPLSSAKSVDELIKLSHYTNIQPLCSYKNRYIKKNN